MAGLQDFFANPPKSDCIRWTKGHDKHGYGYIIIDRKIWRIHRYIMFLLYPDEYSDSLQVNHHCDVKDCFNPRHLYFGTHQDNINDMWEHGKYAQKIDSKEVRIDLSNIESLSSNPNKPKFKMKIPRKRKVLFLGKVF